MSAITKALILFATLFAANAFAANSDVAYESINSLIGFIVEVGRLIGLIIFGCSIYVFYKRLSNPQSYTIGMGIWGMISGIGLQITGILYGILNNTILLENKTYSNDALALDRDTINRIVGVSGEASSSGLVSAMIPPETMKTILYLIMLFGVIGFTRGIFLIKDLGKMDNGTFDKGTTAKKVLAFLIFGIIAMRPDIFGCYAASFFGVEYACGG